MSESDNIQKLQELYQAFGRGDTDMILRNVSDDVTWGMDTTATVVPWYSIRNGRAGVGDFFATLARDVDFTHFQPTIFAGSDETVFVHVDITYRFKKNGASASVVSIHEFNMRGGIITRFRSHEDTASVRDAWNG